MAGRYQAYPEYKDSGVEWLPNIPVRWEVQRTKAMFSLSKKLVGEKSKDYQLLSLTLKGIIPRDISEGGGKIPAEFNTYQEIKPKDLIFCLFDIDETPRTIGLSSYSGMITGAYNVYKCLEGCLPEYAYYYFMHIDSFKGLRPFYTGLRKVVRAETFGNIEMPAPSFSEQHQIAAFLDHETTKIDTLIEKQQQLIALLKEKRQAVISHAVTKGLNPDTPMKDSGVEWLGDVPAHWTIMKLSHFTVLKSGDGIISDQIKSEGKYPVYGGNGVRGYFERFNHDGNYVLVGRQGALCGNINLGEGKFWASEHAIVVYPTRKVGFKWLGSVLKTMNLNQYSISAAQPGLSIENITCLKAPFPPLSEQKEIGQIIHRENRRFDTLIEKAQRSIKLSKERRTALISAAVTGKIDVRNWQPPPTHKETQ